MEKRCSLSRVPEENTPYPSSGRGWWMITVFTIGAVLQYTDRQILNLLIDPFRADLGITDTEISVLQGAAFAVCMPLLVCLWDVLPIYAHGV